MKLFSMFILWEISGKTVKASTRGKWLKFVDRLGKWSLFDSFVMTMFMVGFRFHLHVTEDDDYDDIITQKISPSSFGDLDVVVTSNGPSTSFFATVLSLVLGHVALFIHRKSVRSKTEVDDTKGAFVAKRRKQTVAFIANENCCITSRGCVPLVGSFGRFPRRRCEHTVH